MNFKMASIFTSVCLLIALSTTSIAFASTSAIEKLEEACWLFTRLYDGGMSFQNSADKARYREALRAMSPAINSLSTGGNLPGMANHRRAAMYYLKENAWSFSSCEDHIPAFVSLRDFNFIKAVCQQVGSTNQDDALEAYFLNLPEKRIDNYKGVAALAIIEKMFDSIWLDDALEVLPSFINYMDCQAIEQIVLETSEMSVDDEIEDYFSRSNRNNALIVLKECYGTFSSLLASEALNFFSMTQEMRYRRGLNNLAQGLSILTPGWEPHLSNHRRAAIRFIKDNVDFNADSIIELLPAFVSARDFEFIRAACEKVDSIHLDDAVEAYFVNTPQAVADNFKGSAGVIIVEKVDSFWADNALEVLPSFVSHSDLYYVEQIVQSASGPSVDDDLEDYFNGR